VVVVVLNILLMELVLVDQVEAEFILKQLEALELLGKVMQVVVTLVITKLEQAAVALEQ
jgi:hypothetical protein